LIYLGVQNSGESGHPENHPGTQVVSIFESLIRIFAANRQNSERKQ